MFSHIDFSVLLTKLPRGKYTFTGILKVQEGENFKLCYYCFNLFHNLLHIVSIVIAMFKKKKD